MIYVRGHFYIALQKPLSPMEKRTLKFQCLIQMAKYSQKVSSGYLMNTNNYTLTGKFSDEELTQAMNEYQAMVIETTDKVFSYENI